MLQFCLENFRDVPAPLYLDSWLTFWLFLTIAISNGILLLFVGYKFLQIIQLSGYNLKGMRAWLVETKFKYWGNLVMLSFLSTACLLMTNVLLDGFFRYKIMTYIGLIFYLIFCIVFIRNLFNAPQKTPLKYTHRMTRMCVVYFLLVAVITFFLMTLTFSNVLLGLTPIFVPLIVVLAFLIMAPFEILINRFFVNKAKKIISTRKNKLITIGITGSFGKTTVKNMLTTLLSRKFKVCATPYSFNTPLGLSKTIIEYLSENHEVFITEMGAKCTGDIAYLTQMVHPSIGVITGIGNQHLSTFGTLENLKNTKFELIENLEEGGVAYFNGDSKGAVELFERATISRKFLTSLGDEKGDFRVENIVMDGRGSTFDLVLAGGKPLRCATSLLGKHNISNILLCATIAFGLGVSGEEIRLGIESLAPSSHRLAIVPSANSLIVLDDAYNGSVEGSRAALDVLSLFEGKKFVVTPGLVELGRESFEANREFGLNMAGVADCVILVGIVNLDALTKGLIEGGFDEKQIFKVGSLAQATDILRNFAVPGDVVLFENDLPDNYT